VSDIDISMEPVKRVCESGHQEWHINGKRHRTDGPAFISVYGSQAWYINGRCHRTDGPAVIRVKGTQHWWINGKEITQEVKAWMQKLNVVWPWDAETQVQFLLTFT
jgi:hypothetical protein